MKSKILGLLAVMLLAGPMGAYAASIDSTVSTYVTVRECVAGSTPCDSAGNVFASSVSGQPGDGSVTATVSSPTWGTTSASAELSGVAGAPIIKTYVASEAGYRLNTNTGALQRYTYTGTEVTSRTFGGTLTYSQSVPDWNLDCPDSGLCVSGINASILAFTTADDFLVSGATSYDNFWTVFDNYQFAPGFTLLGQSYFYDYADATNAATQLSFDLDT